MRSLVLLKAAAAVIVIAAATWTAFRLVRTVGAATSAEPPSARVRRGPVEVTVTARGELRGGNSQMMLAPMVGQDTLAVTFLRQPGELVEADDTVAQFDTTQQEYNLREAESDLAEAQQKIIQTETENQAGDEETLYAVEAARTQVRLLELELAKNEFLPRTKARDNEIALEAAKNRLKQAEEDLANRKKTSAAGLAIQRAAESRARVMAEMARKNIENMTLKAKSRGYVSIQANTFGLNVLTQGMTLPIIRNGDSVRPGMAIAQLFDMQSWEVSAMVPELDRGHLAIGQPVSVSVVALAGKTYQGRVSGLGTPSGMPWDRKFECRIALDQGGPELRPGMSTNLVITAEKLADVLWVPSQALFERDGRPFVYLRTLNGFTPHDVTLVKRSESQVVLTGVSEGDTVALSNPSEQSGPGTQQQGAMKAIPK